MWLASLSWRMSTSSLHQYHRYHHPSKTRDSLGKTIEAEDGVVCPEDPKHQREGRHLRLDWKGNGRHGGEKKAKLRVPRDLLSSWSGEGRLFRCGSCGLTDVVAEGCFCQKHFCCTAGMTTMHDSSESEYGTHIGNSNLRILFYSCLNTPK